jgi:hypothetical protein
VWILLPLAKRLSKASLTAAIAAASVLASAESENGLCVEARKPVAMGSSNTGICMGTPRWWGHYTAVMSFGAAAINLLFQVQACGSVGEKQVGGRVQQQVVNTILLHTF